MIKAIFIQEVFPYDKGYITKGFIRDGGIVINHIYYSKDYVIALSEYREQRINIILYGI